MTFNSDTIVEECFDGSDNVPKVTYNLVPLSQIPQMEPNAVVGELVVEWRYRDVQCSFKRSFLSFKDIGGVCREVGDIIQFVAKTSGRELKKRDVTLVDRSSASVCIKHKWVVQIVRKISRVGAYHLEIVFLSMRSIWMAHLSTVIKTVGY